MGAVEEPARGPGPAGDGVHVEGLELVDGDQAEEGVAGAEPVVEEPEGALAVHGDQPQGQLGHLHRQGVDVDAVEAVLGDQAASVEEHVFDLGVGGERPAGPPAAARVASARPSASQASTRRSAR